MPQFRNLLLLLASALLLACSGASQQEIDEREGARQLAEARRALVQKNYDAARDTIMALRKHHPLAINARRQAILLLDSIELFAAQDSLDHLPADLEPTSLNVVPERERLDVKVKFFERKLKHDTK
ncbi:MAG: hypothetical protein KBT12_07285 [Bacteroidales bacterium]|nr:hypothetical protein [Candidatus Physcousia equi]